MASLYEAFQEAEEGIFVDENTGEIYDNSHLLDVLEQADIEGYRYTVDSDNNIIEAIPTENYDPAIDIQFDELDLDDEDTDSIIDDEERLSEIEQECEIWDNDEKFEINIVIRYLGTQFDYLMKKAKETFSTGDHISESDIDGLVDADGVEIQLEKDEYERIALAATGNKLDEE